MIRKFFKGDDSDVNTSRKKTSKKEADTKATTVYYGTVHRIGCIISHLMCRDPHPYGQKEA